MDRIYLDHAASTPVHPDVVQAMLPYLTSVFGNPSSLHSFGRDTRDAVLDARDSLAALLGCEPAELIFTSGGTESDNLALFGVMQAVRERTGKTHLITSAVEHHAVLYACRRLEALGFECTLLPVDHTGRVNIQDVEAAIRDNTGLISVMFANNEVGTLQPIAEIGALARSRGIWFHTDAVQAFGHVPFRLDELPVDLMSLSSHKVNGPKGVGALFASRKVPLTPELYGGSQERKRRAGTENVAGIVGFAKAAALALKHLPEHAELWSRMRRIFLEELDKQLPPDSFVVNGNPDFHLPNIVNVSFPGYSTESLLMNLDLEGIAAASGSACSSGSLELSHVLEAMKLSEEIAGSAIRFSFGLGNRLKDVTITASKLATITNRISYK